jgi:hypothetical protein
MRVTATVILSLALSVFAVAPAGTGATSSRTIDLRTLSQASKLLGSESRTRVTSWLRGQSAVKRVALGTDGRTLDLRFRDGFDALILSDRLSTVALPTGSVPRLSNPRLTPQQGARAAVWEPFASELGLGSQAGAIEAADLQKTGFQVSELTDSSVTVEAMGSLSSYNVVYMHTHSGTASNGEGVVTTGELANGDPTAESYRSDGSVIIVGVAGSTDTYYAITSRFVTEHMGQFPKNSFLFLNGCALLPATAFWQALSARGAGAMVSWSADATTYDDFLSAAALFNQMAQGQSIADAISTLQANGYGTSQWNGVTATLGFRGDGTITLARAAQGQISTATPTPTRTPGPSATPTSTGTSVPPPATATATATATRIPTLSITSLARVVAPGKQQQIVVQSTPGAALVLDVQFPDGEHHVASLTADSAGKAIFSYVQPANVITRSSRTASVQVEAGTVRTISSSYTIRFAPIDLLLSARAMRPGRVLGLTVHTATRTAVAIRVGRSHLLHTRTGPKGWASIRFRVPKVAKVGTVFAVTARARVHGKTVRTRGAVTVVA